MGKDWRSMSDEEFQKALLEGTLPRRKRYGLFDIPYGGLISRNRRTPTLQRQQNLERRIRKMGETERKSVMEKLKAKGWKEGSAMLGRKFEEEMIGGTPRFWEVKSRDPKLGFLLETTEGENLRVKESDLLWGVRFKEQKSWGNLGTLERDKVLKKWQEEDRKKFESINLTGEQEEKRVVNMLAKEGFAHKISPDLKTKWLAPKTPSITEPPILGSLFGKRARVRRKKHVRIRRIHHKHRIKPRRAITHRKSGGFKLPKGLPSRYWRASRNKWSYVDLQKDHKIKAKHRRRRTQPTWLGDVRRRRI